MVVGRWGPATCQSARIPWLLFSYRTGMILTPLRATARSLIVAYHEARIVGAYGYLQYRYIIY